MAEGDVGRYAAMMRDFVSGRMEAEAFERAYLEAYKTDPTIWDHPVFVVLDGLFADVDAFVADPALRRAENLDAAELRAAAGRALDRLAAMGLA
jgi:hypothetical protein